MGWCQVIEPVWLNKFLVIPRLMPSGEVSFMTTFRYLCESLLTTEVFQVVFTCPNFWLSNLFLYKQIPCKFMVVRWNNLSILRLGLCCSLYNENFNINSVLFSWLFLTVRHLLSLFYSSRITIVEKLFYCSLARNSYLWQNTTAANSFYLKSIYSVRNSMSYSCSIVIKYNLKIMAFEND